MRFISNPILYVFLQATAECLELQLWNMSGQAEQEDPLAKATRAAEDLYRLRDTYYPANPDEKLYKLQRESDLAIKLLDSIPPGKFQNSSIPSKPIALL